ncbi:response regulator transcription factor [Puia dinghuensis]|uniref:DNA-binding response regulator n=1 Tax=Puia dinghuensis TaxID=1792502 RepID=A0A8J2U9D2_9BACT|nr:response regulator transcription factor [Puia dinghuensis]GGA88128.1 DNA-binding response regulator [Puia dinghuensis]
MIILLVDGNILAADFIKKGLSENGFQVDIAGDGLAGKRLFETGNYDLVMMDIALPHIDGLELCRQMRQKRSDLPILIVTGRGNTQDKVAGLGSGADDYLLKPFHFEELLARIHALLRRRAPNAAGRSFKAADLEVDAFKRTVTRGGKSLQLTATEFSLLVLLITHKNRVLSKAFISASIWGIDFERRTNLVSVYINYLRGKIDKGFDVPLILTVINEGYMLKEP